VDSAEERFGGPGAKSPTFLSVLRTGWVEIELDGYAAVVYLREATATEKEENVLGVRTEPDERRAT
jgi:hypothetical protein